MDRFIITADMICYVSGRTPLRVARVLRPYSCIHQYLVVDERLRPLYACFDARDAINLAEGRAGALRWGRVELLAA